MQNNTFAHPDHPSVTLHKHADGRVTYRGVHLAFEDDPGAFLIPRNPGSGAAYVPPAREWTDAERAANRAHWTPERQEAAMAVLDHKLAAYRVSEEESPQPVVWFVDGGSRGAGVSPADALRAACAWRLRTWPERASAGDCGPDDTPWDECAELVVGPHRPATVNGNREAIAVMLEESGIPMSEGLGLMLCLWEAVARVTVSERYDETIQRFVNEHYFDAVHAELGNVIAERMDPARE